MAPAARKTVSYVPKCTPRTRASRPRSAELDSQLNARPRAQLVRVDPGPQAGRNARGEHRTGLVHLRRGAWELAESSFVEALERAGELVRVEREVDPYLEMAEIADRAAGDER